MTRKFWGGIAATSLLLTSGAAGFLILKLTSGKLPGLTLTPAPELPPPSASIETPPATADMMVKPALPTNAEAPPNTVGKDGKRNILFKWSKPGAKKVFIVGDFNNWYRTPLKKQDNHWELSFSIAPGTYEYLYVVDDKRIKDPNNKSASAGGKSILKVKPLNP